MKKMLLIATLLVLTCTVMPVMAESTVTNDGWAIVSSYWKAMDLHYKISELREPQDGLTRDYAEAMKNLEERSQQLANTVVKGLEAGDRSELEALSAFYKERSEFERPAFEMVVTSVLDWMNNAELQGKVKFADRAEYFPGYGYADPKYKYRKGQEVEREETSKYWQDEERTIESEQTFEGLIEFELAAQLKNDANVSEFKEMGAPMSLNIGGHIKMYVKVSFRVFKKLVTKAKKQYAVNKVWFELFRAPKTYWSTPTWEVCGKTYELIHEPSGVVATVGAEFK